MTDRDAIKTLADIRRRVIDYLVDRAIYAREDLCACSSEDLISRVISWAEVCDAHSEDKEKLEARLSRVLDDMKDMKRPLHAQMEMQNRTITALNGMLARVRGETLSEAIKVLEDIPKSNIDVIDKERRICVSILRRLRESFTS